MKHFIKLQAIIAIMLFIASCQKDNNLYIENAPGTNVETIDALEAEQQFAIILSRAVAANESLRSFLKEQALQQFDNDYDVFYPYVKDYIIPGTSCTFREILISYSDNAEQLSLIEASLPKLTILVPDYSWVNENCFSVNYWDTASDIVIVGFDDMQDEHFMYYAGEEVGRIPAEVFPEFPVIIVKDNERISTSAATKSGNVQYSFVSPAFDGTNKNLATKGNYGLWGDIDEVLNNTEAAGPNLISEVGDKISAAELSAISPETINAYNEFGTGWNNACQRDYIYYGMSKNNPDNGVLYKRERDILYRFALNASALFSVADADADGEDPTGMKSKMELRDADLPNCADAVRRMWANGKYELKIEVFQKTIGGAAGIIDSFAFSIDPSELMYVTKCDRHYKWALFNQSWNTYSLETAYVEPKWYYPCKESLTEIKNNWNLATSSDNIYFVISEIDQSTTIQKQSSTTFKQSFSVTTTNQNDIGATLKVALELKKGFGASGTYGTEKTTTDGITITLTQNSDELGARSVEYVDNIVTNKQADNYYLKRYGTGKFFFSLIPVDLKNEFAVTNYLSTHH